MHIVVTSKDQNPASFISNFTDSINISDGYEIALISIYHGPIYNITENINHFKLENKDGEQTTYKIPIGYYQTTYMILLAIKNVLEGSNIRVVSAKVGSRSVLQLLSGEKFIANGSNADLMHYLGQIISATKINVEYDILGSSIVPTFIYSNIVSETVIDGHYTRMLATVPLKTDDPGYNFHEFENPVYHLLRVNSFTDISFQLRDIYGELIEINDEVNAQKYPTVMLLHIRRRQE